MKKNKQQKFAKSIGLSLIVSTLLLTSFIYLPKKAGAQPFVPVHDAITNALLNTQLGALNVTNLQTAVATGAQTAKEVGQVPGINPIGNTGTQIAVAPTSANFWATQISRTLIQSMTQSIVNWINSGFAGQPAFVRDPGQFLTGVADVVAGDFIENDPNLNFLCEPFKLEVKALLNLRYQDSGFDVECRLTDVLANSREAYDDFVSGNFIEVGWPGWFSTVHPNGNLYGSTLETEGELRIRIADRVNEEIKFLDWGDGFLSFQECEDPPGATLEDCVKKGPVKTPGVVIEDGLAETLGGEFRQLELADSVDKILNALLNYFITQALSGSGLL